MSIFRKFRLGFLCLALAGCATANKPEPAHARPIAPAVVPAPPAKPAAATVKAPTPKKPVDESSRPSIASTKTVAFDGSSFAAKSHVTGQGQVTGYYLANEAPDTWTRRVELHDYPVAGKGVAPADLAQLVGKQAQQVNPSVHYLVYPNKADGSVILDYLTWNDTDLTAHRLELNIFKFYADPATGDLISFHYAERVQIDPKASSADNSKKVPAVRQRVLPEIAATPLYRE